MNLLRLRTDKYRQRYLKWHNGYEKRATTELQRVFRKWAGELQLHGQPNQWVHQMDSSFDEEDLIKAYIKIYTEIGLVHANRVGRLANVGKKNYVPDFFKQVWERYVALYMQQSLLSKLFDVRNEFIKYLAEVLLRSQPMIGSDPSTVATWIHKQSRKRSFYRWQALRIARTESTAASNLAGHKAVEESGFLMDKIWVSAQDGRTRRKPEDWYDHYHMNGKAVKMNEKFVMQGRGGEDALEFPGDPKGHPANIINCRCTLIYKPRKVNGRLVRQ